MPKFFIYFSLLIGILLIFVIGSFFVVKKNNNSQSQINNIQINNIQKEKEEEIKEEKKEEIKEPEKNATEEESSFEKMVFAIMSFIFIAIGFLEVFDRILKMKNICHHWNHNDDSKETFMRSSIFLVIEFLIILIQFLIKEKSVFIIFFITRILMFLPMIFKNLG